MLLSGDTRKLNRDLDQLDARAGKTEQLHTSAWKRVAVTAGAAIAAIGIGAFVKDTVSLGNQYTGALNNVQAVSGATAATMAKVRDVSRALGSDLTLPATSAYDAAAAMEELAKGGLNVDQAMQAAKGTLMLSAAAQIDAASAAGIQANALNTFALSADQANHVADVLANTANAASGEITDFALGLQQSGTVAHLFGLSIEDTAAALGIFANAGIKGSDAGTSLKTALTALTSPTKQQQQAMDELGLSVYDAQGNFIGLSKLSGQLSEAQGKLTQEQFNAAAATIFGTDAIRAAALMAQAGSDGFDAMAAAVGKSGGAADLAAAKTKGLGGALDGLQSQFETFQIDLYERASPNIEKLVRYAAEHLPEIGDAVLDGVDDAIGWLGKLKDGAVTAFQAIRQYLSPVTDELDDLWDSLTAAHGPAQGAWGALKAGGAILVGIADAAHPVVVLGGQLLKFFNSLPGPVQTAILALGALKAATSFDFFGRLTRSEGAVTSSLGRSGLSVAGFAQTVRTNMRLAGDDIGRVEKLAGGLSVGFQTYMPRASAAVSGFTASVGAAYTQAKQLQRMKVADMFGTEALSKSTGDVAGFNGALKNVTRQGIGGMRSAAGGLVSFMGGPWGVALAAGSVVVGQITAQMGEASATTDQWTQALLKGGKAAAQARAEYEQSASKQPEFLRALDEWTGFAPSMDDATDAAHRYFQSLSPVEQAQSKVAEWTSTLSERLGTYGVGSDEVAAAQRRLDYWTGQVATRQGELASATQTATEKLQAQNAAAMASANADLAASQANTQLAESVDAYKASLADTTLTATQHQQATDAMTASAYGAAQAAAAQAAAHSTASTEEGKQAEADAALLASLQATAAQLGEATPAAIRDLIGSLQASTGQAGVAEAQMRALGLSVTEIPGQKYVKIDAPTAAQEAALSALGYHVEHMPNGEVRVYANTDAAYAELNKLVNTKWRANVQVTTVGGNAALHVQGPGGGGNILRAGGGPILAATGRVVGPGGPTDDMVPAIGPGGADYRLSAGEWIVKAATVRKYERQYGAQFMPAFNAGRVQFGPNGSALDSTGTARASVAGMGDRHYHLHAAVTQAISPREFVNLQREADALYG